MLKEINKDMRMTKAKLKKIISREIMDNKKVIYINDRGILNYVDNGKNCRLVEWSIQCDDFGVRKVRIKEYDGEQPIIEFYDFEEKEFISKNEVIKRYRFL